MTLCAQIFSLSALGRTTGMGGKQGRSGVGDRAEGSVPLKVRTHNEAVTPPLLRETDLLRHILGKSTNLSWAFLLKLDFRHRTLEERKQGDVAVSPRC